MGTTGSFVRLRALALTAGTAYAIAVALLVFGPWGWALNRATVRLYVLFRHDWPVAPDWALPEHYGVLLNVVLFVPLGALLVLLAGRPWWWATLLAAAGSGVIEVVQGLWLDRDASWSDVAANTLGACLGAVLVSLLARAPRSPASRSGSVRRS